MTNRTRTFLDSLEIAMQTDPISASCLDPFDFVPSEGLPLVEAGGIGVLVKLTLGEVYVHVEHDGNPFVVQSASPSAPESCDAMALTAWASGSGGTVQVAQDVELGGFLLDDLPLPSSPWGQVRTDLDGIDYAQWVEQRRDWFKRQCPDVFLLKEALEQEGVEVDYPALLLSTTVIKRFL